MPLRSDWSERPCSIARGIDAVGDPWTLLIIRELISGVRRFDEIRESVGVSDKVLANRLRQLVEGGLATRIPYGNASTRRYEYEPTQAGIDALPILHAFALWAEKHTPTAGLGQRLVIVCRDCGRESSRGETCSECGAVLSADNVSWIRPISTDRIPKPLGAAVER
ncbi:winged helix-turn-helix transcriptional regulator [Paeniglutamicibacter kerguelensis]|uniref:DNA-binding HxlR family transcriptional regulator n=1 Tax=Paeniglutamicibacter kerguelensis TaxID=254788 RepID=A0ABS4XHI9_9MICC|nr:helix-turn-helix domain-containing protein [Paeniglutamicibacter kerguelensis]MBP2387920.1 DNA-binding HxlR family transcriptional regulator [Paeniglutamicibacter kerguelensis]